MATDIISKTPLIEAIGEETVRKIADAHRLLEDMLDDYDGQESFIDECNKKYDEKIGTLLDFFRFPATVRIPENADLALVSIGDYDWEDYWGCHTYNFLVDNEHGDEIRIVGETAMQKYTEYHRFYSRVNELSANDIVRLEIFMYAIKNGIVVYREFCPEYLNCNSGKERLYEGFAIVRE